jgi:hypothetical protein
MSSADEGRWWSHGRSARGGWHPSSAACAKTVEVKRQFLMQYEEITVEWIIREDDLPQYLGMLTPATTSFS